MSDSEEAKEATSTPNAASDVIWGAEEIGKVINRTRRQTFGLLENGYMPGQKIGGRWCSTRAALLHRLAVGWPS